MQALVNYGITELSFNEQVEVEGGILPIIIVGAAALLLSSCSQSNSSDGNRNQQTNVMNNNTKADSSHLHGHLHVSPK